MECSLRGLRGVQGGFNLTLRGSPGLAVTGLPGKRRQPETLLQTADGIPEGESLFLAHKGDVVPGPTAGETEELSATGVDAGGGLAVSTVTMEVTGELLLPIPAA